MLTTRRIQVLGLTLGLSFFAFTSVQGQRRYEDQKMGPEFKPVIGNLFSDAPLRDLSESRVREVFQTRLKNVSEAKANRIARHFYNLCKSYGFSPSFVLALIQVESSFELEAHSPVGARGLMQLMPKTALWWAKVRGFKNIKRADDLYNPYLNLSLGFSYLSHLRKRFKGDTLLYLAAYNAGPNRVEKLVAENRFNPVQTKVYYDRIYDERRRLRRIEKAKPITMKLERGDGNRV